MKKIISIISIIAFLIFPANANQSIIVTAVVGNLNSAPVVTNVNPSSSTTLLGVNETQNFVLTVNDNESDKLYYTITSKYGYVNISNGEINGYTTKTYINFTYLAPSIEIPDEEITITINDGPNVIIKKLNLYIYE